MKQALFWEVLFSIVLIMPYVQAKSLEEMKKELKIIDENIEKQAAELTDVQKKSKSLKNQVEKMCGVDYVAYQENGSDVAVKTKSCEGKVFESFERGITTLDLRQNSLDQSIQSLRSDFRKKIEEAKSTLDPKESYELISYSSQLSDSQLRNMGNQHKGELVKSEYARVKKDIEGSREYSLATKAIAGTLNSDLFCEAKTRCDSQAGTKISEAQVQSKIMKSISAKMANAKVGELKAPNKGNSGTPSK